MKRSRAFLLLLFFIGSAPVWAEHSVQKGKATLLDKILNPLPDFDPFDKAPTTPRFFPDEVDKRARQVLIDSLTGREKALADHDRFFREKDAERLRERGTITGLADHAMDLYHDTFRDRQAYLTAQKEALDSASSEQRKKVIESRIRNDEVVRAEDLLRKSTTNRVGAVVNRLLGSMDLVSLLSGSK